MIEEVSTPQAPQALGAYSQAVKANGFVFVSGQLGIDPETGELVGKSATLQTHQAMKNISAILEAAGSSMDKVVRATIYMQNASDFAEINGVYAQYFGGEGSEGDEGNEGDGARVVKPARVAFGSNVIPKPGAVVEIDAIAVVE
ncbi:regulator [Alloscardovia macacae]|uniref:Regulator n=1 Tax=Alloscardovia macacae TaxID=1160091 RepID=A0A1Y2SY23_9BIFI|nr:Rid family detoxifying hydrolase [Alloscardovia macacae]OTA27446.1 regulator [Alloscardovia macacae]OTA29457.1 regulator [Alloscardovia macacae]